MRAWLAARARVVPLSARWASIAETPRVCAPASFASLAEQTEQQQQQDKQQQQQQHKHQQRRPSRRPAPSASSSSAPPPPLALHSVPPHVRRVLSRLRSKGHEAWLAGGAVRDLLLRQQPRDWDVLTSAGLEEVVVAFSGGSSSPDQEDGSDGDGGGAAASANTGGSWARLLRARHPVALVRAWPGAPMIEVSSLRTSKGAVVAAASPPSLSPPPPQQQQLLTRAGVVAAAAATASTTLPPHPPASPSIAPRRFLVADPPPPWGPGELAAARRASALGRDFTVNALLLDPFTGTVLDYTGRGLADLLGGGGGGAGSGAGAGGGPLEKDGNSTTTTTTNKGLLRAIADPPERAFEEDPARVLRGVRCASRAGLALDRATERAMRRAATSLVPSRVPPRRLAHELAAMLSHGASAGAARLLWRLGLLAPLLPLHASHAARRWARRRQLEQEEMEEAEEEGERPEAPARSSSSRSSSSSSSFDEAGGDAVLRALEALDRRCGPQSPAPPEAVLAALAAPLLAEALDEAAAEVVRALQLARLRPQWQALQQQQGQDHHHPHLASSLAPQTPAARELLWGRRPLRGVVMGAALDVVGAMCRVGVGVGGGGGGDGNAASAAPPLPPSASAPLLSRAHAHEAARLLHAHFVRCDAEERGTLRRLMREEREDDDEEEEEEEQEGDGTAAERLVHAALSEAGERLDQLTPAARALRSLLAGGGGSSRAAAL
jgi:hypothetical protein